MKSIVFILSAALFTGLMSFTGTPGDAPNGFQTGTYGVHGSENVSLTLNDDHTFRYINKSDPANPADASGSWTLQGDKIRLEDYGDDVHIPDTWKIDRDHPCLRSNFSGPGFQIIRLCMD